MKRIIIPVLCALMAMPLYAQKKKDLIQQLGEANVQILVLNEANSQQMREIEELKASNTGLEEGNLEKALTIQKLQAENTALCQKNSELCGDIDAKTADIEQLKKDNEKLKAQVRAKNAVIAASERENKYAYPYIRTDAVSKVFENYLRTSEDQDCVADKNVQLIFDDLYKKSGSGFLITEAGFSYIYDEWDDYGLYTYAFKYINSGKLENLKVFVECYY